MLKNTDSNIWTGSKYWYSPWFLVPVESVGEILFQAPTVISPRTHSPQILSNALFYRKICCKPYSNRSLLHPVSTCWILTASSSSRRSDWCWTSGCSCGPLLVGSGGRSLAEWWSASCQTGSGTSWSVLEVLEKFWGKKVLIGTKNVSEIKKSLYKKKFSW